MKNLKLQTLFLLSLFLSPSIFSQDTIFFKSKDKIVVFVKEISQTEIQYKKFELPDGPMYVVDKNVIDKIIYKNGYTENITSATKSPALAQDPQPFTVLNDSKPAVHNEKITYEDTKRRYYYMNNLANTHPDVNKRPMLLKSVKSIRNLKYGQDATRTVGIVFGAMTIATGAIYGIITRINANTGETWGSDFVIAPVACGSLAVVMAATSIAIHVNLKKKRHAFVKAYNE
jgi:hypothetical protein